MAIHVIHALYMVRTHLMDVNALTVPISHQENVCNVYLNVRLVKTDLSALLVSNQVLQELILSVIAPIPICGT
jgi:hypothetical protein